MRARARIASLIDPGSFSEEATELHSEDPLGFFDLRPYTERIAEAEMTTGLADAMVIGRGTMDGRHCELAVMDFAFMGGKSWTSRSWAGRWAASWARSSRAPATRRPRRGPRPGAPPGRAARACPSGCPRACRCRRP